MRVTRRAGLLSVVAVAAVSASFVLLARVADSDSSITVTQGDFTLTCPRNTVVEGQTLTCTLANTAGEPRPWPVVAIMHLSTDEDRALVRGSSIDVAFGARSPSAALDADVWWIGETLVGYSRFDWPGSAGAATTEATDTRTVDVVAQQDSHDEETEAFYVALGPAGSRGVGLLYNNRQKVSVIDDDAASSNKSLSSLTLTAGGEAHSLSVTEATQTVTVSYPVTEATLTAEAANSRATMTISASHDGADVDLDGRGAATLALFGGEESVAVPLGVGTTELSLEVTAEDGTTGTHRIEVLRHALGAATEVAVSSEGFTLTCPAEVTRGRVATCDLTNTSSSSKPWPVVAVIHNSADGLRALVAEDPIIPSTDPAYSKDVTLGAQQPAPDNFNYGYGELFSGGSRSVYRTYGYEKFDWSGSAAAGASRRVAIELHDNSGDAGREAEVFYVAVAPSGYTGLSQLVANTAPVVLRRAPSASSVSVDGVTQTTASVSVTVADHDGSALHLRHRASPPEDASPPEEWTTQSKAASSSVVEFSLADLTAGTAYDIQASFDPSFASGVVSASFTTQADGGSRSGRPTVTEGPAITSSPAEGDSYGEGEAVEVSVTFSEAVAVTGEPWVVLTVGDRSRLARYAGGDGTATLTFAYTVKKVDSDEDGVSIEHQRLQLGGGSVVDADGNAARLRHPALADQAGHKVNVSPLPPTVTEGPAITSSPAEGDSYGEGEAVEVSVTFSEAVAVTGEPWVVLTVGDRSRLARYAGGDGTATLTFAYTVKKVDSDEDGVSIEHQRLQLGGGSVVDADGNAARLRHPALADQAGHKVNVSPLPPTVTEGPAITSSPAEGDSYGEGEAVEVSVTFSEAVAVTGEPWVVLTVGGRSRLARYAGGDGTATLTFAYTVKKVDSDEDGVSIEHQRLQLGGGSVVDADGNAARLRHPALADQAGHKVNVSPLPPTVTEGPAITSSPAEGDSYGEGEAVEVSVTFSEAVAVTGEPWVVLTVGGRSRLARYAGGDGTATLTFAYTVKKVDSDDDGVSIEHQRLQLGGGSVVDADGNAARLRHPALADQAGHKVNVSPSQRPAEPEEQPAIEERQPDPEPEQMQEPEQQQGPQPS